MAMELEGYVNGIAQVVIDYLEHEFKESKLKIEPLQEEESTDDFKARIEKHILGLPSTSSRELHLKYFLQTFCHLKGLLEAGSKHIDQIQQSLISLIETCEKLQSESADVKLPGQDSPIHLKNFKSSYRRTGMGTFGAYAIEALIGGFKKSADAKKYVVECIDRYKIQLLSSSLEEAESTISDLTARLSKAETVIGTQAQTIDALFTAMKSLQNRVMGLESRSPEATGDDVGSSQTLEQVLARTEALEKHLGLAQLMSARKDALFKEPSTPPSTPGVDREDALMSANHT